MMFERILVVCVGNICRSPVGEAVLKSLLPTRQVSSAGFQALVGRGVPETGAMVAGELNIDITQHAARQLTHQLCVDNDLILVMERGHIDAVCAISPAARGKVMLYGQWLSQADIPDPYKQSREAFDHAYDLIQKSAQAWVQKLT